MTNDASLAQIRQISAIISRFSNADDMRDLLISPDLAYDERDRSFDDMPLTPRAFAELAHALQFALNDQTSYHPFTEQITELCLNLSLCPLHRIDYAICFDDDDAECAQIRRIHPSHDT